MTKNNNSDNKQKINLRIIEQVSLVEMFHKSLSSCYFSRMHFWMRPHARSHSWRTTSADRATRQSEGIRDRTVEFANYFIYPLLPAGVAVSPSPNGGVELPESDLGHLDKPLWNLKMNGKQNDRGIWHWGSFYNHTFTNEVGRRRCGTPCLLVTKHILTIIYSIGREDVHHPCERKPVKQVGSCNLVRVTHCSLICFDPSKQWAEWVSFDSHADIERRLTSTPQFSRQCGLENENLKVDIKVE